VGGISPAAFEVFDTIEKLYQPRAGPCFPFFPFPSSDWQAFSPFWLFLRGFSFIGGPSFIGQAESSGDLLLTARAGATMTLWVTRRRMKLALSVWVDVARPKGRAKRGRAGTHAAIRERVGVSG